MVVLSQLLWSKITTLALSRLSLEKKVLKLAFIRMELKPILLFV